MLFIAVIFTLVAATNAIDTRTVLDYLSGHPEFSILNNFLAHGNLTTILSTQGGIFTLFAPTNDAFNRSSDIYAAIQSDPKLLYRVLTHHILESAFISIFMYNERLERTLGGSQIRFNIYPGDLVTADGANITTGNIVLRNGVIHVIDRLMFPAEGDILRQVLVDDAEFEDLTAAFAVTNLLGELEFEAITVFAPSNSAFARYYNQPPNNLNEVRTVLQRHIVNGTYYPSSLAKGGLLHTLGGSSLVIVTNAQGVISVNGHVTDGTILSTNGIIYVLQEVIA